MTIHVFVGPSLSADEVRAELDVVVHGPAAFGDVYRVARDQPTAIAIVDGYFDHVPAVWHKEVLWALAEGIAVFGASSMGALRAAELDAFGMVGVGEVYEAFRSGALEDDDEVAVAHGAAETGFRALSDAMVNVRFTLAVAEEGGVIGGDVRRELVALAKQRFYAERSYRALLHDAERAGIDVAALRALTAWLPGGKRDQKRADALRLLRELPERLAGRGRAQPPFHFEPTDAWQAALMTLSDEVETTEAWSDTGDALVEELKLEGDYWAAHGAAAGRAHAVNQAVHAGVELDRTLLKGAVEELRKRLGLGARRDFEAWRAEQRLDEEEWARFVREEARVRWAYPRTEAAARSQLVSELRARGQYGSLLDRVEGKRRWLAERGGLRPGLAELGLSEADLWQWYFTTHRGLPLPADLATYAYGLGFATVDDFRDAVLGEFCYERAARL
ncbi:MAG TPA: TfuA-like protein [Polyangiaceae bacterium]|nr:TfuA-like protein [Polyangiaceae bacterium]